MLIVLLVAAMPVSAQLGDTDTASITIQNVSGGSATVTVDFYSESGTKYTPTSLGSGITNPFDLADGASKQIVTAQIPIAQLPSGRYSVVITSTAQVIAQVGLAGSGTLRFSGATVGFSAGSQTIYLPAALYNFSGWYSMISVQNLSSTDPADITVSITCANGTTGTLTRNDVPALASTTFALKSEVPTGFTTATTCDGSAVITSDQNIVAVNNQNKPATGATNSLEGAATGGNPIYVPNLMNNYSGWNSNLTIMKLDAGTSAVTVTYSDGETDTCNLTDAQPACKLYQPSNHTATGRYSATISGTGGINLMGLAASTKGAWSGATSAVASATGEVNIPNVSKAYFGWNSAINCQVIGGGATTLHVSYSGYEGSAYNTASLPIGGSVQIQVFAESLLPASWQGGATITANTSGAEVACTVGNSNATNSATKPGDWTSQYNAYNK